MKQLRIIAGEKKGLALQTPKGLATRPTQGRVRESLFMILRDRLEGARVLDLFAGCGSLGLEALSRGAARATFVENARPALEALRANIARAGWEDRCRVLTRDALASIEAVAGGGPYDLALLDPPYHRDLADRTLGLLAGHVAELLAPGAWVVAQLDRRERLEAAYGGLERVDDRPYSETRIAIFERLS